MQDLDLVLLIEIIISLSGTVYKSINQKRYLIKRKKEIKEFIIDKTLIKIGGMDMALGCYRLS